MVLMSKEWSMISREEDVNGACNVTVPRSAASTQKLKGMCVDYPAEAWKVSHVVDRAVRTSADGTLPSTKDSSDAEGTKTRLREAAMNLLVVISDPGIQATVCRIIDKAGLKAVSASTLREAREILLRERIPLVICSARLHDGTFRELLSVAPKLFAGMVVLCSEGCPSEARIDALELGILDYVSYPLPAEELLWVLQGALVRSSNDKKEGAFRPGYDRQANE